MKNKLEERLKALKSEYTKGQERLEVLNQELAGLKASMLRISGAIQVLEELLESANMEEDGKNEKPETVKPEKKFK